jgi:NitT/TauT family transport system substrate-binding protein/putative hydroxymethylpyrimidine transport system substrate-binding protein
VRYPSRFFSLLLAALLAAFALASCGEDQPADSGQPAPARIALDFVPNAAHSGIYAGRDGGDGGSPLEVRVPSGSTDSLKLLASGRADLAVVDIHDLGLARQNGTDVVGVGGLVQRPLAAVIARPQIARPRELEGRRVGIAGLPSDEAVLRAVVENDGGDYDKVRKVTIGFAAVKSLAAGKVDAVVAFWNVEGVSLRRQGVPTREFRVDDYGAPRYPELVLAVQGRKLADDPGREQVTRALESIRSGTERALSSPSDAVAMVADASKSDPALVQAQFDAIRGSLSPPVVLDRGALEGWAQFDARFGILDEPPDITTAFDLETAQP